MHTVLIPIVPYCIYVYLYIPSFTVLCPVFLPACHTTGLAWVPLYDYTTLHFCRLVQCITVSYWASVGPVPLVFLLCISLYVTCSMSCTFCVYVICAPSHLAPRIPFLYSVVRHTLSVCSFSTFRRFGRFASDCIDTANLPHRDFVFIHPSSSASLVAGRLNYGVVQAVSAANVRGSSHTRTWRASVRF